MKFVDEDCDLDQIAIEQFANRPAGQGFGPDRVLRYNGYLSADLNGQAAPGRFRRRGLPGWHLGHRARQVTLPLARRE